MTLYLAKNRKIAARRGVTPTTAFPCILFEDGHHQNVEYILERWEDYHMVLLTVIANRLEYYGEDEKKEIVTILNNCDWIYLLEEFLNKREDGEDEGIRTESGYPYGDMTPQKLIDKINSY